MGLRQNRERWVSLQHQKGYPTTTTLYVDLPDLSVIMQREVRTKGQGSFLFGWHFGSP